MFGLRSGLGVANSAGARPTEPPQKKLHVGSPLSASKMESKDGFVFSQNATFIRFCMSCIFVRFLMNEPDVYVLIQNAIASDFASTYPNLNPPKPQIKTAGK